MKNYKEFKEHVLYCYPQEAVGYIYQNKFCPLENTHPDPVNNFQLSEKDSFYLCNLQNYSLLHSHTMESFKDDPRTPSYEDMQCQSMLNVEFGIVHCDGLDISDILYFGKPKKDDLIGRTYVHNVYDCFTLARDFYWKEKGIDLGTHPRPADWESWDAGYIENNYKDLGFSDVSAGTTLKRGDILLFNIASRSINHIGVFIKEDIFIHHLYNRKSCEDSVNKWNRQLVKVLRLN